MIRIRMYMNTGFCNATREEIVEIDKAEWDSMTSEERAEYMDAELDTFMTNYLDCGWYLLDEEVE